MAAPRTRWNACDVLNVDPSVDDFRCVGYAGSKKRKCRNPIAAANCQEASKALLQMSRLDPSSARISEMLETLAKRVLCKRNHQNQRASVTERWRSDLARFRAAEPSLDEPNATETLSEPLANLTRVVNRQNVDATETLSEILADLTMIISHQDINTTQDLSATLANFRRTMTTSLRVGESLRATPASSVAPPTPISWTPSTLRNDSASSVVAQEVYAERELETTSTHPVPGQSEESDARSVSPNTVQRTPVPEDQSREDQTEASPQTEQSSDSPISPESQQQTVAEGDPTEETTVDEADSEEDLVMWEDVDEEHTEREHHTPNRRRIEGNCSICHEELGSGEELAYCEARCGQNFHEECINTWLSSGEHTQTCPWCRADWIEYGD
ncbi:hypothetical protein MMC28_001467 [Mycoblastus sanguinarius]|nr:hypothetical protein [Mycoblastus sanguinarius]